MGKPIPVERNPNPTQEQVDELHAKYCQELTELFEKYKLRCGAKLSDHLCFY